MAKDIIYIAIVALVVAYFAYKVIHILRLPPKERRQQLKLFVMGFIIRAEEEIGSGNGQEKLAQVKEQFTKRSPLVYKLLLTFMPEVTLDDIIEEALAEIKMSFKGGN